MSAMLIAPAEGRKANWKASHGPTKSIVSAPRPMMKATGILPWAGGTSLVTGVADGLGGCGSANSVQGQGAGPSFQVLPMHCGSDATGAMSQHVVLVAATADGPSCCWPNAISAKEMKMMKMDNRVHSPFAEVAGICQPAATRSLGLSARLVMHPVITAVAPLLTKVLRF